MSKKNVFRLLSFSFLEILICFISPLSAYASGVGHIVAATPGTLPDTNCQQPPDFTAQGIDPTTLSNETLQLYHLPLKPNTTDSQQISDWKNALMHAKHQVCPGDPSIRATDQYNTSITYDSHFSGWQAFPPSSFGLNYASSSYPVPCVASNIDFPATSSHWVGIQAGSNHGGELLQDGVDAELSPLDVPTYDAWVESYPYDTEQIVFNVNCGDSMYSNVSLPNQVFIEDNTSGIYYSNALGPSLPCASHWLCISEWPQGSWSTYAAQFSPVHYSYCMGEGPNGTSTIAQQSNVTWDWLKNPPTGDILFEASGLDSNGSGFTTTSHSDW